MAKVQLTKSNQGFIMITGSIYLNLHQDLLVLKFLKRVKQFTKYKVVLVTFSACLCVKNFNYSKWSNNKTVMISTWIFEGKHSWLT